MICGLHHREQRLHCAPLAALRRLRLAAGRGGRAAGLVHREDPRRYGGDEARQLPAGGGVGGRHHQGGLQPAPPVPAGQRDSRPDELSLPHGGSGVAPGRRRSGVLPQHGNAPGELSPARLLLRHELPGVKIGI